MSVAKQDAHHSYSAFNKRPPIFSTFMMRNLFMTSQCMGIAMETSMAYDIGNHGIVLFKIYEWYLNKEEIIFSGI